MAEDTILIVGGGLGGLGAALGLARTGRKCIVLEQAPAFGEIGAGIQLGPNAFQAFDYLGVGDEARREAVFIDELVLMDALDGKRIAAVPLGPDFRERFGNPYAVVHRADLHMALVDACRASNLVELRTNHQIKSYRQDDRSVTAVLSTGDEVTGAALVAADGLWSNIRSQLANDGPPIVSGHTTYRSVIPTEQMPEDLRWNAATLWAGPKVHLVHYPLKGWKVFNLVITAHNNPAGPAAGVPIEKNDVLQFFSHVHPRAQQIIMCGNDWKYWVLCDREPIRNWVDGRVVLLGDAAHPMLQYMAQGACMALEDGVCLSRMVERHGNNLTAAFQEYNRLRAPRTARVQVGSRLMGEYVYHASGAKADMRNAVLSARTPEQHFNALAWLYGGPEAE